jgi:peptide/nickel transport system permease protein
MKRGYSFLIQRVISVVIAIFIVLTVEFVVFRVLSGPIIIPKGGDVLMRENTMEHWATNEPLVVQYFVFLKNMLTGDFGDSTAYRRGAEVSSFIYDSGAATASLFLFTAFFSIALGTLAGISTSKRKARVSGRLATLFESLLWSVPVFIFSLMIIEHGLVRFDPSFPIQGRYSYDYSEMNTLEKIVDVAKHALFPSISIVLACFGAFALVVREGHFRGMNEGKPADLRTSLANAESPVRSSALSDLFHEFTPHTKLLITWVLSCVIVTEVVFSWQGLGYLLWSSAMNRDFVVEQAVFFLIALFAIFSLMAWDLLVFVSRRDEQEDVSRTSLPEQAQIAPSMGTTDKLQSIWHAYKDSTSGLIALGVFLALGIMAIVGPMIVDSDYTTVGARRPDAVSLFVQGGREPFTVAFLTVLISTVLGLVVGILALMARVLDNMLMVLANAFLAVPLLPLTLIVAITIDLRVNPSIHTVVLLISTVMWAPVAMIVRNRANAAADASNETTIRTYRSHDALWLHIRDALSVGKFVAVIGVLTLTFLEFFYMAFHHSWGFAIGWTYFHAGFMNLSLDWILPVTGIVLLGVSFYKVLEHLERALTKVCEA